MFHHHHYHKQDPMGQIVEKDGSARLLLKPGRHYAPDLAHELLKRVDVVSMPFYIDTGIIEVIKSLREYAAIQANKDDHRFKLETFEGDEYNNFLTKLFETFNGIFFMNLLPRTKISETLDHEFPPAKLIVHRITTRLLSKFAAEIKIHGLQRSWNHIGALLGVMIELYLKYYGCDCLTCQGDKDGYGSTGKGNAWQRIAHKLETSAVLQKKINGEFFQHFGGFDLYRKQLYIDELSHRVLPEHHVADPDTLAIWGWDTPAFNTWLILEARKKFKDRKEMENKKTSTRR
ncbi:hypothetical protein OCU04_008039 [Sclerotinia nivalis]|uniref:Uncharacterized protein n=1 Tax=Sclerotinia nivalis TaxID=352851 RepID=A0A9X0AHD4_9HELO|nr:hypothetical protein OCU04_008039 [Sclerotinia nivalis]